MTSLVYTLSLHDALPISVRYGFCHFNVLSDSSSCYWRGMLFRMLFLLFATASIPVASLLHADETFENAGRLLVAGGGVRSDRKSTRLNSSHVSISCAVFC